MAGELQSFVMGGFVLLAFSLLAVQLISVGVSEGGHSVVDFPLANQTDAYLNDSDNFRDEFLASVQQVSNAPPELSIAAEGIFGASVSLKATTFTVQSLTLVLNIFATAGQAVLGIFGIPAWVVALGITAITVMFAFAVLNVVTRYSA